MNGPDDSGSLSKGRLPGYLDHALEVLRIPSTRSTGTADLTEYLHENVLKDLPVKPHLIPASDRTRRDYNLLARFEPGGGAPGILLVTHLDTVEPGGPGLWTETAGDPFNPTIKGERIYGLGSADTKLDWLCKAEAVRRTLGGGRIHRPVYLLGTFGEETGMDGAREFIASCPIRPQPVAAFVGEPTILSPVNRTKGRMLLTLSVRWRPAPPRQWWLRSVRFFGRSAHASQPRLGLNAVRRALSAIRPDHELVASIEGGDAGNKVPALCQLLADADNAELLSRLALAGAEIEAAKLAQAVPVEPRAISALRETISAVDKLLGDKPEEESAFSPPTATLCLTRIRTGTGVLSAMLDIRLLPGQESVDVLEEIGAAVAEIARRADPVTADIGVEIDNPSLDLPVDAELVSRTCSLLRRIGRPAAVTTKAGCTEAGLFLAAGIPSLVLGPGASYDNIHAPNEFNSIDQLNAAVSIYEAIIEEFCGQ